MKIREKIYCATMLLAELLKQRRLPGDTRSYLSLDDNDAQVVKWALEEYLARQKSFEEYTATQR